MESRVQEPICSIKTLDVELLGKPIHIIRERLENLISESCIYLSNELQNWLSTNKIKAKLVSVDLHRFEPNSMDKEFTSTFQHLEQGKVFLHGDARVLIKLADRFYGASMERTSAKLSASDLRLQERIGNVVTNWLAPKDMWRPSEYESPQGIGLHAELSIAFDDFQGSFHVKLDNFFIQTLIEQLELQPDVDLYQPFCRSLESTPVRVNAVLSKKKMALSDVINLKANDILPIDLLNTVPISIGSQSLFTGRVADQDGQLVLIINSDKESQR